MECWNNGILGKKKKMAKMEKKKWFLICVIVLCFWSTHYSIVPIFQFSGVALFHYSIIPVFHLSAD
jgi:hypothetical protein